MRRYLNVTLAGLLVLPALAAAQDEPEPPGPDASMNEDTRHMEIPPMFRRMAPHKAMKLEHMRSHNPDHFRQALHRLQRMEREMKGFQASDMEEFRRRADLIRLEDEVEKLGDACRREKDEGKKNELRKELAGRLETLFDKKEEAARMHIERMEQDIKQLEGQLDNRRANRAKIIEKRLRELTEGDDLEF